MTNRTALPAIFALLAMTAAATAADLPSRKAPLIAPPPVFTWDGFYIGGEIGYGFGTDRNRTYLPIAGIFGAGPTTPISSNSANTSGVLGGAFFGYNWQIGQFVLGAESDIEFSNVRGTAPMAGLNLFAPSFIAGLGAPVGSASYREDWRTSSRIRIGYSFGRLLVYAAGGGTYGMFRFNNAYNSQFNVLTAGFTPLFGVQENYKATRFGGTIGAGAEYAITDNWIGRLEYRYTDFGTEKQSLNGSPFGYLQEHRLTDHSVRAALAYKFGGGGGLLGAFMPFLNEPTGPGTPDWTGLKVGGQLGYGWGTDKNKLSQPFLTIAGATPYSSFPLGQNVAKPGGVIGGAHIGFDRQWGRIVSGAEVSIEGSGINGKTGLMGANLFAPTAFAALGSPIGVVTTKNTWRGAVTGRIGYAWGPALIYALSGMSFAQFNFTSTYNAQFWPTTGITPAVYVTDTISKFRLGGTIGGGVEYALTDRWSVRAEYRYTDFGKFREIQSSNALGMVQEHRLYDNVMQAGFSYNFTPTLSAPVGAKY